MQQKLIFGELFPHSRSWTCLLCSHYFIFPCNSPPMDKPEKPEQPVQGHTGEHPATDGPLSLIATHSDYSPTWKKPPCTLAHVYQRHTFSNKPYHLNEHQTSLSPSYTLWHLYTCCSKIIDSIERNDHRYHDGK